jgi:hypothetical protein
MRLLAVPYCRRAVPEGTARLRRSVAYTHSCYALNKVMHTGRDTAGGGPRRTAGHGGRRTTADHSGPRWTGGNVCYSMLWYATLYYGLLVYENGG